MEQKQDWSLKTHIVHSGLGSQPGSESGTPTVPPIFTSTTYLYNSLEEMDQSFDGKTPNGEESFVYARHGSPSVSLFEEAMARMEGGLDATAFGSGMAAIHAAFLAAGLAPGAKVLASNQLFGATVNMLRRLFAPIGVEVVFADLCASGAGEKIREEEPDVVFVETLSNPLVRLVDLDEVGEAAHESGAVTIVDNTFATPLLTRPLEHQCDLVIHSATKYLGGHGDSSGGVVVSGSRALADQVRMYKSLIGAILSPYESHLLLRGVRTLSLRIERQCQNALVVASFLQGHPAISKVHYSGLPKHSQHQLADRLFGGQGYGGLLAFELRDGSRSAVARFIDSLELCLNATTLGDLYSLVTYPAVSTHRNLQPEERRALGISDSCIRMSVGVEDTEDIIRDLSQALKKMD